MNNREQQVIYAELAELRRRIEDLERRPVYVPIPPKAKPKREPLSIKQLEVVEFQATKIYSDNSGLVPWSLVFAREIERAHGITGDSDAE